MKTFLRVILLCSFGVMALSGEPQLPRFVVMILSYNNAQWYQQNLDSVFMQDYPQELWRVVYVDDCSSDNTGQLVAEYIEQHGYQSRVTLIRNIDRKFMLHNLYSAVHTQCAPEEIIVQLDGDDWFAHAQVLSRLAQEYQNPDIWIVYAQFQTWPAGERGFAMAATPEVIKKNLFRTVGRMTSPLRSYYAWLFKRIKRRDLRWHGSFFPMAGDVACMIPMFEMAGERHRFIDEIFYIYNRDTPLNEDKVNGHLQYGCDAEVRRRGRYKRLSRSLL